MFEEVFIRVGLPYKVVGGVRFYERKEVRDALAYLRLLANPDDTVSCAGSSTRPKRGIGDRAEACVEASPPGADLVRRRCAGRGGARHGHPLAQRDRRVRRLLDGLSRASWSRPAPPAALLGGLLDRTGYLAELQARTTRRTRAAWRTSRSW